MITQTNKRGMIISLGISFSLAVFTGWRTWDLFSQVLPPEQIIAAFFGIAALDGGMVGWTLGYMKARGSDQRLYSGLLVFLDFVGVCLSVYFDLQITASHRGLIAIPPWLYMAAIILITGAVMANVGGGILYALSDPKARQEMRDERAHSKINDLADATIEQHAAMYAPQFAQFKVEMWLYQARMQHGMLGGNTQPQLARLPQPPALPPVPDAKPDQKISSTGVPYDITAEVPVVASTVDIGKARDLLSKAVKYGQLTQGEADAFLLALGEKANHQGAQNGHKE